MIQETNTLTKIKKWIKQNKNYILAGISFTTALYFLKKYYEGQEQISLSDFITALKNGRIDQIKFDSEFLTFKSNDNWYETFYNHDKFKQLWTLALQNQVTISVKKHILSSNIVDAVVGNIFSSICLKYLTRYVSGSNHIVSPMQINANVYKGDVKFSDYYGGEIIKQKMQETILFLKDPQKFKKAGARIRRGILLYGPPGTGKTMLAKALATQAGCDFIHTTASQFREMLSGLGAKRVRQLFKQAKKCIYGCIIFIDQIDALGTREGNFFNNHETTNTINQFLSEMDGFELNDKIVVVGATNRLDLLDPAIKRSGRFDVKIEVKLPDTQHRIGIFRRILQKKLKDKYIISENCLTVLGELSQNWSGAGIQNLINESIYHAISQKSYHLSQNHILAAYRQLKNLQLNI